jgi:hypothetical protein
VCGLEAASPGFLGRQGSPPPPGLDQLGHVIEGLGLDEGLDLTIADLTAVDTGYRQKPVE